MQENLFPYSTSVSFKQRAEQLKQNPSVLWFTGLSGSGKSTLANVLYGKLHQDGFACYLLDGDNIRTGLCKDLSFSDVDRVENIRRIAEVSKLFLDAGLITICCFVSPFEEDRANAKNIVGTEYFSEIYVECPVEVCAERDVKGLYKKAMAGEIPNFTGISSPYEAPQNPDIKVSTHLASLDDCLETIYQSVIKKISL